MLLSAIFLLLLNCNPKQSPQQTGNPSATTDTSLQASWTVKGCAAIAEKADTKFPDSGEFKDYPDLPVPGEKGINTDGDSIVYSQYREHLCCRRVNVTTQRLGNVITFTENWYGRGCKCNCRSTLRAVVNQLPKGEYRVYAIYTATDPFDDKPNNGRDTIFSQQVIIK